MPCDYLQLPHQGIRNLAPYIPGKPIEALAQEQGLNDIIKLASNENPLGCSPYVKEALNNLSSMAIATYPIQDFHPLKRKLSLKLKVDEKNITFSNGSDLLVTLLLIIFALKTKKHVITHDKAFATYAIQAKILGIPIIELPLKTDWQVNIDSLIKTCNQDTALIFLANPNNPTGGLIPESNIKRLLTETPNSTLIVIDEAYYEYAYAAHEKGACQWLDKFPKLVVIRTFSKAYGLAGLRLGYAIAHQDINQLLQRVQLPFTVNQAAMTAAVAALDDKEFLSKTKALNQEGLKQMYAGLETLKLKALPSYGNFICFDCGQEAMPVYQALLQQGIIVRPLLANYELRQHLRVSIGTRVQNERFLDTLALVLKHHRGGI